MSKLDMLLRQVADEEDVLLSRRETAQRMAGRFQRFAPGAKRRVWLWVPVAAAVAAAATLLLRGVTAPPELAVTIGSSARAPLVGAWLGAPDAAPLPLDFSDGSRFELKARARARVVGLEPSSPRVELASGALLVHVIPGGPGTWHIDAGPFGVKVTGTRFLVSYEPESDRFEVSMDEGQVELTGCVFGKGRKLAVGQRVRASCRQNQLEVSYRDVEPGAAGSASALPPAAVASESVPPPAPLPLEPSKAVRPAASAGKATPAPWLALARSGKYKEAYAAADQDGFEAACQRSTAEELLLLADAARHARATRQAKHALLLVRQRFGGGADAATAAFVLGRLEFDELGAPGAAADWFRTYLGERPSGPMAREALGRLMEAYERAGDSARAADAARRYLRDYPTGPHAALASRLEKAP
jgi:hypothetical protein